MARLALSCSSVVIGRIARKLSGGKPAMLAYILSAVGRSGARNVTIEMITATTVMNRATVRDHQRSIGVHIARQA